MKEFSSELGQDYGTYTFGYTNYAEREDTDVLADVYNKGYLPYTNIKNVSNLYYMCRNIRIPLADWKLNSENRRVYGKFDDIVGIKHSLDQFDVSEKFLDFCANYFAQRHGSAAMPRTRIEHMLTTHIITHIVEYKRGDELVGYVFLIEDETISHYIFSFYDLNLVNESLGMWLMIDCIVQAQKNNKTYHYLGTAYGEKGLYKTNFDKAQTWDGKKWVESRDMVRARCRADSNRTITWLDYHKEDLDRF